MFQSLLILGRQPALGLAELESLYGADSLQRVGRQAVLLDTPPNEVSFDRLGGSIKLAKVLTEVDTAQWDKLVNFISQALPEHLQYIPEGKIKFGISAFDLNVSAAQMSRSALSIKKVIKAAGRSVRVVPNTETALNSAQVRHNQLTSPVGMELVLVRSGNKTIIAQTVNEQDVDAYAARDQKRPKRDARVGMLPPKLAQIIINLAIHQRNPLQEEVHVMDPFCGTGVVLQEALLMGCFAMGSDLDPLMVAYTKENIAWLHKTIGYPGPGMALNIEVADATDWKWVSPFDTLACETYLGRPFSSMPTPNVLAEVMQDVDTIHKKFLRNVAAQTEPGFRMCIAVPAWKTPHGFKHLKALDSLEELGYTRMKFVHASNEDLVYHREGQIVARELVVLIRK